MRRKYCEKQTKRLTKFINSAKKRNNNANNIKRMSLYNEDTG